MQLKGEEKKKDGNNDLADGDLVYFIKNEYFSIKHETILAETSKLFV